MSTQDLQVHVRIDADLYQRICDRAEREDRTLSDAARRMLKYADRHMPETPSVV